MDNERAYSSAKRWGWTLIELLAVTFMIAAPATAWLSVSARHGTGWGSVAAFATGSLSFIVVALFYWLMWRLDERALQKARDKYRDIYRVIAIPIDPRVIVMPAGAEIRAGDYGWEAGPSRNDGMVYLQGLTPDWTVVWHMGVRPNEIEKVGKKTHSQYDAWHPYWADPPPLPPCPFPVLSRKTMTVGRPHYSHRYFDEPTAYCPHNGVLNDNDVEAV